MGPAVFLASEAAAMATGIILNVDGGMTAQQMITGLTHPGISVSNLEDWLAFIRNNLNTGHINSQVSDQDYLEKVTGLKGAKLKIGFVSLGENSFPLEIIEYLRPKGRPSGSSYGETGSPHIFLM